MTWPEMIWVTSSDQGPVTAVCPWRWTKPPSHTQCKSPSAGQVTFHLTLLQFSSGWGTTEEIFFPWEKVWLSLASPHWGERVEEVQAPPSHPVQHLLLSWRRNGDRESAPKHLQQQQFTLASHIHVSPGGKPTKGPKSDGLPVLFLLLDSFRGSQRGLSLHRQWWLWGKLLMMEGWHCSSTPCGTDVLPSPSPGAESCSSEPSQH